MPLREVLKEIMKGPNGATKLLKTAWQTIKMVASGVWSVYGAAKAARCMLSFIANSLQFLLQFLAMTAAGAGVIKAYYRHRCFINKFLAIENS